MMIWDEFKTVYDLLEDDLSKKIYEERVNWLFYGGEDHTKDLLYSYYASSEIVGLEQYSGEYKFAICGAGNFGQQTLRALRHAGKDVIGFIDNDVDKQGKYVDGVLIFSFPRFVETYQNALVIVILDNQRLNNIFFAELFELGWNQSKIYRTKDDIVRTAFGKIYFDLPELELSEDEIFVDAGSFNGDTVKDFIKNRHGKYRKIYALEPMEDAFGLLENNFKGNPRVELKKCALSSSLGEADFAQAYAGLMGSRLGCNGDYVQRVKLETIDHLFDGKEVTFIKFDIEGAELEALKGGVDTLKRCHPRLAISLYHKRLDMIEIPLWIKNNAPDYKFYLRHYSNKLWDLVLYCV